MQKEIDNINNKMTWLMVLLVVVAMLCLAQVCHADSINVKFKWAAVTVNADNSPCTDLAGYALYRSRESNDWTALTGAEQAYAQVLATETTLTVVCPQPGTWFWAIRAFNNSGVYGAISNVLENNIDVTPGVAFNFRFCRPGDMNCDGDVDGKDLVEFSEAFGK